MPTTSNYSNYASLSASNAPKAPEVQSESEKLIAIKSLQQRQQLLSDPVKKLTIIDNYTSWCGPCKAIAPKYSAMADKFGNIVNFCKEDAEEGVPGGKPVTGVPCFHFYFEGKLIEELTVHGADITEVYNNMMKFMKVKEPAEEKADKKETKTDKEQENLEE